MQPTKPRPQIIPVLVIALALGSGAGCSKQQSAAAPKSDLAAAGAAIGAVGKPVPKAPASRPEVEGKRPASGQDGSVVDTGPGEDNVAPRPASRRTERVPIRDVPAPRKAVETARAGAAAVGDGLLGEPAPDLRLPDFKDWNGPASAGGFLPPDVAKPAVKEAKEKPPAETFMSACTREDCAR